MPIIKVRTSRVRMVRRNICRLQEPNRDSLALYTRFIADTAGYVVSQLSAATSDSSSGIKLPSTFEQFGSFAGVC